MAKAKTKTTKREPTKAPASRRWRITLLKATPAKFIGYVRAPDAKSAIEMAIKYYGISNRLVDRLLDSWPESGCPPYKVSPACGRCRGYA